MARPFSFRSSFHYKCASLRSAQKEFVDYLTYYVNQRLGESNQDVFRGYATSYDNIEGVEKVTPCAIKKIRASEVASVGELEVMMKVSERSERAFWKTSILAMKFAKLLQT